MCQGRSFRCASTGVSGLRGAQGPESPAHQDLVRREQHDDTLCLEAGVGPEYPRSLRLRPESPHHSGPESPALQDQSLRSK